MRRRLLSLIVGCAAIFLIVPTARAAPVSAISVPMIPNQSVTVGDGVGAVVITVLGDTDGAAGQNCPPPADGNKYVALQLTFQNPGTESIDLGSSWTFGGADGVMTDASALPCLGATLPGATIPPGGQLSGIVAFEVPQAEQGKWIRFLPGFGNGAPVLFNNVAPQAPVAILPTLSATINPVPLDPLLGSTGIVWDTGTGATGQVFVSEDGGNERLFCGGSGGMQPAGWIAAGHTYTFTLYKDLDHLIALKSVPVTAAVGLNATPSVSPAGAGFGTTTVTWSGGSIPVSEIWVSVDGGKEALFAREAAGAQDAPWIVAGHVYTFNLYPGTSHAGLPLRTVTVTG